MLPLTLRTRVLIASGLGAAGVAALAWRVGSWLQASERYPLHATVLFVAVMAVAIFGASAGHPFTRFGPANQVTMTRAMIVALVAAILLEPHTAVSAWWVVWATSLMAILDGLDGWLARRTGMASDFGARFDMETDALLILVLSVLVWQYDKAGAWVMLCGAMRYAFVAAGWVLPWMAGPLQPTLRGKTVAVSQLVGLSVALAPVVVPPASTMVAVVTLLALVWSFAIDVGRLRRGTS